MKEEIKYCEHCGAKITGRWESLTKGLCNTLLKFSQSVKRLGKDQIHLQKECGLTKNEYNNFQKLGYFGLVKDSEKSGFWSLTVDGILFIRNEMSVSKKVYVFRDTVKEVSSERVFIQNILPNPYWLTREDYI